MAKTKRCLPSGIDIEIKDMSIDDIDFCKDSVKVAFDNGQPVAVNGVNASRTLWLRKGLVRIDDSYSKNGEGPPDSALKLLTEDDKIKAAELIQKAQVVDRKKNTATTSMSS